ncbi:hypothetical protein AB6805_13880 [Chitinophaga sp. RCC_12]|uniref:hypothetical protein n=1 Tax=Chitinophaga sp. RCC_12 TaxID=3239226 RepID=UPI003525BE25
METEMEQVLRLTYQMLGMGLSSALLHQELTSNIIKGYSQFAIAAFPRMDNELFKVLLSFNKDNEDGCIKLNEIKAYSRRQLPVYYDTINNISIDQLENRIKDLDWHSFSKGEINDPVLISKYHKILNELADLAIGNNKAGKVIQEKLMFKYWISENLLADAQYGEYLKPFEREEVFYPGKDIFTVRLAANIFSGKLDDLFEKVLLTGVERFGGAALKEKLRHILSKNPTDFDLVRWYSDKDGTAKVNFSISLCDGYYNIDSTKIDYKSFSSIPHLNLNESTDRALEQQMAMIDWNIPEVERFGLKAKFQPEVLDVLKTIKKANAEKEVDACSITDLPTLKFWLGTPFEDHIRQSAWNLLESIPVQTRTFDPNIEITYAINLLSGRAVAEEFILFTSVNSGKWVRIDPSQGEDDNQDTELKRIVGFTEAEIEQSLTKLPIFSPGHEIIINDLHAGDLVEVQLTDGNVVLLESNPEEKSINLYNPEGERIYIDLLPAGETIPPATLEQKPAQENQKKKPRLSKNKQNSRRKQR